MSGLSPERPWNRSHAWEKPVWEWPFAQGGAGTGFMAAGGPGQGDLNPGSGTSQLRELGKSFAFLSLGFLSCELGTNTRFIR